MPTSNDDQPTRLLHLSDIHFRADKAWDADPVLQKLTRFIAKEVNGGLIPDLVAITGDLAFAGTADEYQLARNWLNNQLWPALPADLSHDRLLLVPGNHDVDRKKVDLAAKAVQKDLLAAGDQNQIAEILGDAGQRDVLLKRHAAYLEFLGDWLGEKQPLPWWQRSIEILGVRLHVAGLDSAWMACGDEDHGRLLLGRYQINQTVLSQDADDADWRLALLHHPWGYFAEFDGDEIRSTIHQHCDLLLRGHLHKPQTERVVPPDPSRACLELAAGCVYENSRYPNAFQWIELYPRPRRVKVLYRAWIQGAWIIDRNQPNCSAGDATFELPLSGTGRAVAAHSQPAISKVPPSARTSRRNTRASRDRQSEEMHQKPTSNQGDTPPGLAAASAASKPPVQKNRDDDRCDMLLLYVNEKERVAIVETFIDPNGEPPRPRTIRGLPCLDLGEIGGRRIFATATNMGSATPGGSATLAVDAITKLDPKWIIAVGVAFGMDPSKVPIGTILVSDRVSCYEPQRVGKKSIHRGDTVTVHPHLKQFFQTVSSPPYWKGDPVQFGQIISGEKLIDDPAFKGKLRKAYPEAIGGEMEAAGIYGAALLKQRDWIIVKAVCDYADGNKGEDKDNRQTLAAKNAAAFVRHVLTAYDHPASIEELGPPPATSVPKSEQKRAAGTIHRDAIAAITESLDLVPALYDALAGQPEVKGTKPMELAKWLCAPDGDVRAAIRSVKAAMIDAAKKRGDISTLRERALDILGWMVITTVMEGYEREDAGLAKTWFDKGTFEIPLGRNPCVEVLMARWRGNKAEFVVEKTRYGYGADDITPGNLQELGFDDPTKPETGRAVDYVRRLAYQKIFHVPVPTKLSLTQEQDLDARLDDEREEKNRRLRLIIDRNDPDCALGSRTVINAIHDQLPQLLLIFVHSGREPDNRVFVIPPSKLASAIYGFLEEIEKLS